MVEGHICKNSFLDCAVNVIPSLVTRHGLLFHSLTYFVFYLAIVNGVQLACNFGHQLVIKTDIWEG